MKQKIILAAGAALAWHLWSRGKAKQAAQATVSEGTNFHNASDWQGDLWTRLNGAADLIISANQNVGGNAVADPGKVGTAATGLVPTWNGGYA